MLFNKDVIKDVIIIIFIIIIIIIIHTEMY